MKKLLLSGIAFLAIVLFSFTTNAQQLGIKNYSSCTVMFYVAAEDGSCNNYSTNTYTLGPGASMVFDMVNPMYWPGGLPAPGSIWSFVKMGALSGPYSGGTGPCVSPIPNINVVAVGNTPCTPFLNATCMDITACSPVKVKWYPSGADVKVGIY